MKTEQHQTESGIHLLTGTYEPDWFDTFDAWLTKYFYHILAAILLPVGFAQLAIALGVIR